MIDIGKQSKLHPGDQAGQAAVAFVLLSVLLAATLFGAGWLQGNDGALGVLWQALHDEFRRFAAAVALP